MSSKSGFASRDTRLCRSEQNFASTSTSSKATTDLCVMGLDLSTREAGLVALTKNRVRWKLLRTKPLSERPKSAGDDALHRGVFYGFDEERFAYIASEIIEAWTVAKPALVIIEDYAYSRHSRALTPLHELGGVVKFVLWAEQILWKCEGIKTVKKDATGNGNASKEQMLTRARELWPGCPEIFDIADAFHLARYGLRNFAKLVS